MGPTGITDLGSSNLKRMQSAGSIKAMKLMARNPFGLLKVTPMGHQPPHTSHGIAGSRIPGVFAIKPTPVRFNVFHDPKCRRNKPHHMDRGFSKGLLKQ